MNSTEQRALQEEILSKYKEQIDEIRGQDDELQFVFDDKKITELSKNEGWISLGIVRRHWVHLIRTGKRIVYILVLSALAYEGIKFVIPEPGHIKQIYGEYCDVATWHARVAERQPSELKTTLSFRIDKQQPHTPEEDYTTLPTATTLNVPISGLSTELFKRYNDR